MRVSGPLAWDEHTELDVDLAAAGRYRLRLSIGLLTYSTSASAMPADLTLRDIGALTRLVVVLDPPDPDFAIVTP